jgi:thiazole synthase
VLVKEGFTVLPYTSDDPSWLPIASSTPEHPRSCPWERPSAAASAFRTAPPLRILREIITAVPLIVDAGVGTASDATLAMELGVDGVLMNTGIAGAQDPVLMAEAMKHAVLAGRQAYLAGRMPRKLYATASSPLEGVVQ